MHATPRQKETPLNIRIQSRLDETTDWAAIAILDKTTEAAAISIPVGAMALLSNFVLGSSLRLPPSFHLLHHVEECLPHWQALFSDEWLACSY